MARRSSEGMLILWPLLGAALDIIVLASAMIFAYQVRFQPPFSRLVPIIYGIPPFENYLRSAIVAAVFWGIVLAIRGIYRPRLQWQIRRESARAISGFFVGFAILFALLFFYRDFMYSRTVALLTLAFGSVFLFLVRVFLALVRKWLIPIRPFHRALAIGPHSENVFKRLGEGDDSGLKVVGVFPGPQNLDGEKFIDKIEELGVDTVLLAYGLNQFSEARSIIDRVEGKRLHFLLLPEPDAMIIVNRFSPLNLGGLTAIQLREAPLSGWNGMIKRIFDLLASLLLLVISSPLFILVGFMIKLTSRGPILYRQTRVGLDGRSFSMLKFRTMKVGAEKETGPVWAKRGDSRTTLIGRILRRLSLDELPQLYNVLRGDMSLVGPRPERPEFVSQFRGQVPHYVERHRMRSGMTGWAQVNGLRGQSPIEARTRYDLFYIENWSLGFDFWILARTIIEVFVGRNAY